MDFVSTVEKKEGPGVWLAKRGVTFVALTRVGRWNFLAPTGDGSWESVPIGQRMPIFNRAQTRPWTAADYEVKQSGASGRTSASVSAVYRFPKKGTALERQMLAATPRVFLEGYRRALERAIPDRARVVRAVLGDVHGRREPVSAGEVLHAGRLSRMGHELHGPRLREQPHVSRQLQRHLRAQRAARA